MTIKIGSNIASLQAQRRLGEATSSLGKIYERLSSGQRINRASDDAAGLAIAEDLKSKSRIFTQAIRNVNDGMSVNAIADATVTALSDITIRLKELSEQSANGTYSTKQRDAIDKEAQALSKEYFRVSRSAQFNGQKLFDGSLVDGLRLQVGIGVDGSILTHVGGALGTGSTSIQDTLDSESGASNAVALGDLNGDGILDLVSAGKTDANTGSLTIRLGTGNGSYGSAYSYSTGPHDATGLALGDLNGDGILDIVTIGLGDVGGNAAIRLGVGDGSFGASTSLIQESTSINAVQLGDLNGDGILDLVTAGRSLGLDSTTIRLGTGSGSFGASTSYTIAGGYTTSLAVGDLNGDGILDLVSNRYSGGAVVRLGAGNGTFGAATSYSRESLSYSVTLGDLNGDNILDLITAGYSFAISGGLATVRLGTGNGSFGASTTYTTESFESHDLSLADLNGDGFLDLVTTGRDYATNVVTTQRMGSGSGVFGAAVSAVIIANGDTKDIAVGDVNGDGVSDILVAGYKNTDGKVVVLTGQTRDGISPLQTFSLKSRADSLQAFGLFSINLNNLSSLRGTIGANQSRLEVASSNLASTKENYTTAESRITDADIAQDAANLIRTQILQQAATSILAQANQAPALALLLLR